MHIARLRKVGDSVILAIPAAVLDQLDLRAAAVVGVTIENGRLIVERAVARPRHSLAALLAECWADAPLPDGEGWTDRPSAAMELI